MGIIQDTLTVKTEVDIAPIVQDGELTTEKIGEVLTELRKGTANTPYGNISRLTGVSEEDIAEIHEEMLNQLNP